MNFENLQKEEAVINEKQGRKEMVEIQQLMQKNLPVEVGFQIEPNSISSDETRRAKIKELFGEEELMNFIKNSPETAGKVLKLYNLLAGK